jgi:hypothetical protein
MKSKSIKGKSPEEIQSKLAESMTDARLPDGQGFKPTLAIVFLSISQDRNAVCEILDKEGISIYGATTNGEFIDEEHGKDSIVILLLDMKREYFHVFFEEFSHKNFRETTQSIANAALKRFSNPAFLIAGSHMETDAEELLRGFEDIIGNNVNVYGGMAGDGFRFKETFVFTNKKSSNKGVVAVAMNEDKIMIKGKATCGWKAVGTPKTVTKSNGNHVFTIDDIPVLEATAKYGGLKNLNKDNKDVPVEIATNFPLQLQKEKGAPVMRPGLLVNWEDGSFICSGSVPQGAKVKFSLPPDFDVIETVIKEAEKLKADEMPDADALIVYNCGGRLLAFGPLISKEIEGIKNIWDVPMAGMFSNGELARATGGNLEMHNLTTCCVVLKEK